jgi:hypothetical protein
MKKLLAALAAATVLLAACGDDGDTDAARQPDGEQPDATGDGEGDDGDDGAALEGDLGIFVGESLLEGDLDSQLKQIIADNPDLDLIVGQGTRTAPFQGPAYTRLCAGDWDLEIVPSVYWSFVVASDNAACEVELVQIDNPDQIGMAVVFVEETPLISDFIDALGGPIGG